MTTQTVSENTIQDPAIISQAKVFDLVIDESKVAWLTFDYPGEKVNKFSSHVMAELSEVLDQVEADKSIQCLVICSAKKGVFIAGADVKEIMDILQDAEQAEISTMIKKVITNGVATFNKLESLHCPSIAVIDGACMGGGLEMALACTYRVATDDSKTSLALPEVNLGIIPGWGGTQRLPRLVGLMQALPMILAGKKMNGKKAFKMKLVDALIPREFMDERLREFIKQILSREGKSKIMRAREPKGFGVKLQKALLENNPLGRNYVFSKAEEGVLKQTAGKYPAPLAAIDVLKKTYNGNLKAGLASETDTFVDLTTRNTDICKNLVNLFFTMEGLKKDSQVIVDAEPKNIEVAGVLGAGVMGGGIGWLFSYKDIPVRMKDITWDAVAKGYEAANDVYGQLQKRRRLNKGEVNLKMHKITGTIDYSGFENADIIVEAIVENMDVKKSVLQELEKHISPNTLIASNTSALSITEMQSVLKHPERFVGMHFFNPVNRMPLVEIIPGEKTSPETVKSLVEITKKLGKTAIVVGDCAGFLVNRILIPSMNEGLSMLEEGVDIERIDRAIKDFGMPMGPFVLADEVGIDVAYKVAKILEEAYGDRMKAPEFVATMVDRKWWGKKVGKGFYSHSGKNNRELNPQLSEILKTGSGSSISLDAKTMVDRFVLVMLNEACRCLDEKIIENPAYLDMAMITGTGFPPFRGGLLRYADSIGLASIVERMNELASKYGDRFKPVELLVDMAEQGKTFY